MDQDRQQLVKKLQESANLLITVSKNPSVDQLASAIGLTLVLNKMNKHATAVFSGDVPSTIEFLKPEDTLEKTTDSLRDFIISLDKAKADKLRYKVEDKVVRIFITPYHTSLSEKDLEFSQGDFNVDVVVALGVHEQKDLDDAITAHGRILHDAVVVSINSDAVGALSGINLLDARASSLAEIVAGIADELKPDAIDGQIATAFLTGIVAETERFSNEKTTSATMTLSAGLMKAGANQQLVATKLQESQPEEQAGEIQHKTAENTDEPQAASKESDGSLLVEHSEDSPEQPEEEPEERLHQVHIDEKGILKPLSETVAEEPKAELSKKEEAPAEPVKDNTDSELKMVLEPPQLGGTLTANSRPEAYDPSTDPLSLPAVEQPLLSHDSPSAATSQPAPTMPFTDEGAPAPSPSVDNPLPALTLPSTNDDVPVPEPTLSDLENSVTTPVIEPEVTPVVPDLPSLTDASTDTESSPEVDKPDVDEARDAVLQAINASTDPGPPNPIAALNASTIDLDLGHNEPELTPISPTFEPPAATEPAPAPISEMPPVESLRIESTGATGTEFKMPENLVHPDTPLPPDTTGSMVTDPTAPPPVPPPLMPPLYPTPNPLDAGTPPFPGPQPMGQPADSQPAPPPSPFNLP